MQARDLNSFGAIATKLFLVFGIESSVALIKIWFEALADLELADVERGVNEFISTREDYPNPAKIRSLAEPCGLSQQEFCRILNAQKRPKWKVIMPK